MKAILVLLKSRLDYELIKHNVGTLEKVYLPFLSGHALLIYQQNVLQHSEHIRTMHSALIIRTIHPFVCRRTSC